MNTKEKFTQIYKNNSWRSAESRSGAGGEIKNTVTAREIVLDVIQKYNIKTFLDAPCGDFNWMNQFFKDNPNLEVEYIGADIVSELIQENKRKYEKPNRIEFIVRNIIKDQLPETDLILCRDAFVHFSYADIKLAIQNIKKNKIKYLLTTSFENTPEYDYDISTGEWRPISLEREPFNLKALEKFNEKCIEGKNNQWIDKKFLYLFDVESIEL